MDIIHKIIAELGIDYKILGTIQLEIIVVINQAPVDTDKTPYIQNFLENFLAEHDIRESFNNKKLILIYDEVIYDDWLIGIHSFFHKKCCNLDNIFLITTHTSGATIWYNNYLQLFGQQGINIIEANLLFGKERYNSIAPIGYSNNKFILPLSKLPKLSKDDIRKNLKFYFNYYGGSKSTIENDFLVALMLTKSDIGSIDYLTGFTTDLVEFDNYLEQLTNFTNRNLVDTLLQARKLAEFKKSNQEYGEPFNSKNGFQHNLNSITACQVIRETYNNNMFSIVTEKTVRTFFDLQIPIPISGVNSVNNLKKLGFNLDYDIVDYSYQTEPIFFKRMMKIIEQIDNLTKYTLSDLEEYIINNRDILCYNYDYVVSGAFFENSKQNLINGLTND